MTLLVRGARRQPSTRASAPGPPGVSWPVAAACVSCLAAKADGCVACMRRAAAPSAGATCKKEAAAIPQTSCCPLPHRVELQEPCRLVVQVVLIQLVQRVLGAARVERQQAALRKGAEPGGTRRRGGDGSVRRSGMMQRRFTRPACGAAASPGRHDRWLALLQRRRLAGFHLGGSCAQGARGRAGACWGRGSGD